MIGVQRAQNDYGNMLNIFVIFYSATKFISVHEGHFNVGNDKIKFLGKRELIALLAVLGLAFVLFSGVEALQELNQETAAILGTDRLFIKRAGVPFPQKLEIRYGEPIVPDAHPEDRRVERERLMEETMASIARLGGFDR